MERARDISSLPPRSADSPKVPMAVKQSPVRLLGIVEPMQYKQEEKKGGHKQVLPIARDIRLLKPRKLNS